MDFVTGLPISINWKRDRYNSILVIIDWLTKVVHYKPIKITINAPGLVKVIIDVLLRHHGLLDSNVINKSTFFILKFCSSLCYFLSIKRWLSIIFYLQINGQIKKQNSTMKAYLRDFVNFE